MLGKVHFNPPTPCGVGLRTSNTSATATHISIHPPHAGWDLQPRRWQGVHDGISIHPPHAGWDLASHVNPSAPVDFNPPTPCGVGRFPPLVSRRNRKFQSTHPMRGGTHESVPLVSQEEFQSTHPMRGGTITNDAFYFLLEFQSTHPMRGGTVNMYKMARYDWTQVTKETTIAAFIS